MDSRVAVFRGIFAVCRVLSAGRTGSSYRKGVENSVRSRCSHYLARLIRQPVQCAADPPRDPAALAAMSYDVALDWAGADFHRLVAVAKARDYRPEWIAHQLANHGLQPSAQDAEILSRMVADAGPYISRRHRCIMRQLRIKPLTVKALAAPAGLA